MVVVSTDEHGRVLDNPPDGRYLDGPAMHALEVSALWKTRLTQRLPRLIIPSTAFDAMLVGCCAVRCSSYVLARRLDPDVLAVIESFASSAVISSGAAAALQEATEEFATRLFRDVFFVAHQRLSLCVHAGDVDAAIDLTGAYRLVGRRRVSGDLCASCIKPDGPATLSTFRPAPDPEGTRPDPPRSRPSLTWCEKAPLDGSGPQSAIRRALKILAVRGNCPHLAPGALDAVASACVGFCRTVLTRARGGDSEVLRSIAAEDRRVAALRDVLAAQYDALSEAGEAPWQESPWSEDDESVESESSLQQREWHRERRSSGGAQTRAMSAAATDWSSDDEEDDEEEEAAGAFDGLTSRAVEDALNYLGCRVYAAVDRATAEPGDAFELAAAIPPAVLANAVDVEPDILAFDFGRLISGLGPPPADAELRRAVFVSRCPDCGTTCVAFRLDYAYNDDRTEVVFAQSHDVSSVDELRSLEASPGWAGRTGLDTVRYYDGGSTSFNEIESMDIVDFDDMRVPPSYRAAAREVGLRSMQWPDGGGRRLNWLTDDGPWFTQLLPLIMAARDASSFSFFSEVVYDEPRIRFAHVLHAIILVLEDAPRRLFPIDLSVVDSLVRPDGSVETDIDAIKQRLGVSQTEDLIDFQRVSARSPSIVANINTRAMKLSRPDATLNFDDDAAQLLSWFLKRRLVQTFALARRVPYSVLCPHTGNGGMLTLNTFQLCRRLNHEIF